MKPKPWTILSSNLDKSCRVFNLRTDHARSPRTGRSQDFYVMESSAWVNIIPLTPEGDVVLVRQYRHGTRSMTLEIPGGLVEDQDEPEAAALRELREETGYTAASVLSLGYVHPNPAIQNNRCYTFLAESCVPAGVQSQDESEDIEVILTPLHRIPLLIREGAITHALVIAAFYRYYVEHSGHGR
jgi:ADP-ribose pyrophosphatase